VCGISYGGKLAEDWLKESKKKFVFNCRFKKPTSGMQAGISNRQLKKGKTALILLYLKKPTSPQAGFSDQQLTRTTIHQLTSINNINETSDTGSAKPTIYQLLVSSASRN